MERGVLSERASDSFRCAAVTDASLSLSLSLSRSSEQNLRQGRVKNVRRTPGLPPITPPISKQQQPPPSSSSSGVGHGHGAMDYPRDFEVDVNQYRPPSATFQQQLQHFHPTPSPQPSPLRSRLRRRTRRRATLTKAASPSATRVRRWALRLHPHPQPHRHRGCRHPVRPTRRSRCRSHDSRRFVAKCRQRCARGAVATGAPCQFPHSAGLCRRP